MLGDREAGNAIHRIGNDHRALRELAHRQALRRHLLPREAGADLALGFGMQRKRPAERGRGALPRVIVGRRADAAEAEHHVG